MIVSVTALGSRDGDAAGAVARVVDYLEGRAPAAAGRTPSWWDKTELSAPDVEIACPAPEPCDGAIAYYADSVEGSGTWMGRGFAGQRSRGVVAGDQLQRMLLGQDPMTGEQRVDARGSALRAKRHRSAEKERQWLLSVAPTSSSRSRRRPAC